MGVFNNEDTFAEILKAALNEQSVNNDIKKIEVLNGGIPGSMPERWLRLYKRVGREYDPDIVVIVFFLRDGTSLKVQTDFIRRIRQEITLRNHNSRLYQHFFTYRIIRDLLDRSIISKHYTKNLKDAYLGDDEQTRVWQLSQEYLLSIKSLAEQDSAEVGFVIYPILVELNDHYQFNDIHRHLTEFALSNGFHFHDLFPSFFGCYCPNLWVSSYDQHPNEKAHHIAAESMLPFIKELLIHSEKES